MTITRPPGTWPAGLGGGRVARALAWPRPGDPHGAALVAARAGQVTGVALTAAGPTPG